MSDDVEARLRAIAELERLTIAGLLGVCAALGETACFPVGKAGSSFHYPANGFGVKPARYGFAAATGAGVLAVWQGSSPVTEHDRRLDGRVGMLMRYVTVELDDMSDDYVFREAIVKAAVRDFAHDLVRAFPDHQDTIADIFEEMAGEVPAMAFEDVSD